MERVNSKNNKLSKNYDLDKCFFKKVFALPKDLRSIPVDNMRKMSEIKWKCGNTVKYTKEMTTWTFSKSLEAGKEYLGIPYANTKVSLSEFKTFLKDGIYTPDGDDWGQIHGVQCVSSVICSLQSIGDYDGWSEILNPASEHCMLVKVGDYKTVRDEESKETCESNGREKMAECYSLLKKGDVVIHSSPAIHVRIVSGVNVVTKEDGKIDSEKSYITCVEQTASFDRFVPERNNSTWFIDHKYPFDNLFDEFYLPVTAKEYSEGAEDPYIAMDEEITPEDLAQGKLCGTVFSNRSVRYVYYKITDKKGAVVSSSRATDQVSFKEVFNKDHERELFDGLPNGEYKFILEAGINIEGVVISEVEFTYSKQ